MLVVFPTVICRQLGCSLISLLSILFLFLSKLIDVSYRNEGFGRTGQLFFELTRVARLKCGPKQGEKNYYFWPQKAYSEIWRF